MIKKSVITHAITKTVVAVLWIMLLCLTTYLKNILNFSVDTFDNCLSDVHCPITLSLHAVNKAY